MASTDERDLVVSDKKPTTWADVAKASAKAQAKETAMQAEANGEKKNGRAKKPKQQKLPGTERAAADRHPDIEKAAKKYVAARDERMELTKEEVKTQAALVAAMNQHKLNEYRCDDEDLLVTLKASEVKAKVKKISAPDDEDEE